MEDTSRKLVTIDEANGCRINEPVKTTDPDGDEYTDYILDDVEGTSKFKESIRTTKSVCDAVRWSIHGRFAIASIQCHLETE